MRRAALAVIGGSSLVLGAYELDKRRTRISARVLTEPDHSKAKWDDNWDRRHHTYSKTEPANDCGDGEEKKQKPKATRHLILIRHGQYDYKASDPEEKKLTALATSRDWLFRGGAGVMRLSLSIIKRVDGREQAELTAERLKALNLPISRIVISTMTRAQETGAIISKLFPDVEPEHCNLIREGAPIPPDPPSSVWRPEAAFFEDGARIEAGYRKYFHRATPEQADNSYELLVCHANVIRYYVCRALQLPPEAWLRISLHNGSITWLTIRPNGKVSLRLLGDCGYMDREKLSTT